MITDEPAAGGGHEHLYKIDPSRNVIVKAAPIPGTGPACAAFPGPHGIWIGCAGVNHITLINQDSLKPAESLRVDSGGYTPQIVPGRDAVWVLTPSGLVRADTATGRITAIIHVGYAPSAMSAPALVMDSAGRLWITGSLLAVTVPGTRTAYPVARTPDLISAAADGPDIWLDTGSGLVRLQLDTPRATGASWTCPECGQPGRSSGLPATTANRSAIPARVAVCSIAAGTGVPPGTGRSRVALATIVGR